MIEISGVVTESVIFERKTANLFTSTSCTFTEHVYVEIIIVITNKTYYVTTIAT